MPRARATYACLIGLLACEAPHSDRIAELATPIDDEGDASAERFLGKLELPNATIDNRRIGPTPLIPARLGQPGPGEAVIVEFETSGLQGASGRLGLLPPRGAARQEVAHDMPGQADDPRSVWIDIEIEADGPQRFELPAPGHDWHAAWAVVALELRRGRTRLPVTIGARSEMVSDHTRARGGRAVLGVVAVERRPTRVRAALVDAAIELDGRLDEPVWQRDGAVLLSSRTGEPSELDTKVGGPTLTWFAWDREHLYVAASLPDPDLHAPHQQRDEPLYRDEAFELFIAADNSGNRYLEHQVSARNVVFDARFPKYRRGDESWNGSWRSAVALDGELGRRGGDRGWTVELAFPWTELCEHTAIHCPPKVGATLRVNAYRLDKPDRETQIGLALSPTLEPDFHAWSNAAELELLGPGVPE